MSAVLVSLLVALVAAAAGWAGAGLAARSGPQQVPVDRSNHADVTPAGAGLGIAGGVALGVALAGLLRPAGVDLAGVIGLFMMILVGGGVAAIGILDDVFDLPPRIKFALLAAASTGVAYAAGPVFELPVWGGLGLALPAWAALGGATLWVFTVVNAANFMDGADGLAGGAIGVAAAALALAAWIVGAESAMIAAAALAGALGGFLPWNAPKARVFMGDVGSLFIGLWFAGAGLLFIAEAPRGAVYLPPMLLLPILADTLLTLGLRARRRSSLLVAHRDHAYQVRLRREGGKHTGVARSATFRAAVLGVLGLLVAWALVGHGAPAIALGAFAGAVAVMSGLWRRDRRGEILDSD